MTPNTHTNRLLLGLAQILRGIDELADADRVLATVHTADEAGRGEIRLDWGTPEAGGKLVYRHFRISIEEVK